MQRTGNPWGCLQSPLLQPPPKPPLGARTRGSKAPEHIPVPQHRSGSDPRRHGPFFCQVPLSHAEVWGPRGEFILLADPERGAQGAQGTPRGLRAGNEEASSSRQRGEGRILATSPQRETAASAPSLLAAGASMCEGASEAAPGRRRQGRRQRFHRKPAWRAAASAPRSGLRSCAHYFYLPSAGLRALLVQTPRQHCLLPRSQGWRLSGELSPLFRGASTPPWRGVAPGAPSHSSCLQFQVSCWDAPCLGITPKKVAACPDLAAPPTRGQRGPVGVQGEGLRCGKWLRSANFGVLQHAQGGRMRIWSAPAGEASAAVSAGVRESSEAVV